VGIDRPDDGDVPVIDRVPGPADRTEAPAEVRDRATYYAELRAAVAAERPDGWDQAAARLAGMWAEHEARWPAPEQPASSPDEPSSWRGAGGRSLDAAANAEVERGCDRIREIETEVVTPAMRGIEAHDPGRGLVGLDQRCKGEDRLKEKVAADMAAKGRPAEAALSAIPDAIRYTFCYNQDGYTTGTRADIERLESEGFTPVEIRNTWDSYQYKGINSRWREPDSGQIFEVQFHTRESFEAKQLTHPAYERLRDPATPRDERPELDDFQRRVCASVPVPPGATQITEQRDEPADHLLRDR
jgi:hypothetical protein